MSNNLIQIDSSAIEAETSYQYANRYRVTARIVADLGKRLNAALASALMKGEPSWMMFK